MWRNVTRNDTPLEPEARNRVPTTTDESAKPRPRTPDRVFDHPPPPPRPPALRLKPLGAKEPRISIDRAPTPVRPLGLSTPGLDRNTARRLKQGKIVPDARIDLHGMTADRAHRALTSFLMREHAAGSRCVLVITGKGGRTRERSGYEMREHAEGAGVLKSQTPHWLATPPLAQLVVGVFQASIRHGGAGALYVYLRKPRR
ncbi:MAG: Smr/MutS family protein [Pseudomonadota bacterium]